MTEFLYKRLVGPLNPKKPNESLGMHYKMLKFVGLWAPETSNKMTKTIYNIYSIINRGIFLYLYTFCQAMFFINVDDLKDVIDALFFLMTQVALIYKAEKFYMNRHRIRVIVKQLNSDLFCPMSDEEDQVIKIAMLDSILCCLGFLIPAYMTCCSWAIVPFMAEDGLKLPVAAWYPFDTKPVKTFMLMYVFQIYGIVQSATINVATDTIGAAMLGHVTAQIERLGIMLSRLGYESETKQNTAIEDPSNSKNKKEEGLILREYFDKNYKKIVEISELDDEICDINSKVQLIRKRHGKNYSELIRCVLFHERILDYVTELEDIFKEPIFCQFMFSSLIICMTLLLIISQNKSNISDVVGSLSYLMAMIVQIFLFCWTGNEVIYASHRLSGRIFFANFSKFDRVTSKAMMIFMIRTSKDIIVKAGTMFQVTLSVSTFLAIIKSSYSYFAVLHTMQSNE